MKESMPLVSVIVTTYNHEKTIAQTLESILNQKCSFNFEIIIGEDCSKDNTRKICNEYKNNYPTQINLLLNENNKGVIDNYFDCFLASKGEYIADCAGDDYWIDPLKLQKQIDILNTHKDVTIVHTNWKELNVSKQIIINDARGKKRGYKKQLISGKDLVLSIVTQTSTPHIHLCTACFRKDILLNFYQNDTTLFRNKEFKCEDLQIAFALSYSGNIWYMDDETLMYRTGQESMGYSFDNKKQFNFIMGVTYLTYYITQNYNVADKKIQHYYQERFYELLMYAFREEDKEMVSKVELFSKRINEPFKGKTNFLHFILLHSLLYIPAKRIRDLIVAIKNL